jgi:hypothetical protein
MVYLVCLTMMTVQFIMLCFLGCIDWVSTGLTLAIHPRHQLEFARSIADRCLRSKARETLRESSFDKHKGHGTRG